MSFRLNFWVCVKKEFQRSYYINFTYNYPILAQRCIPLSLENVRKNVHEDFLIFSVGIEIKHWAKIVKILPES